MPQLTASRTPDQDLLEQAVSHALEEARLGGADQAEAAASVSRGLSVTVRKGEVESLEYQRDRGIGITVYVEGRQGSASTADLGRAAVCETVRKALSIARFTARDDYAGLAPAERMVREVPDLGLCHPWALDAEQAIEIARRVESAALGSDDRITNTDGGSVGTHVGRRVYGNSHGLLVGYPSSSHSLSCVVMAGQGDDMHRDHWYSSARDPARLEDAESVGRRAATRVLARLGARQLSTREAPVLFAAEQARGLVGHLVAAVRGGAQYRKSSFLCGAMGQQVLPEWLGLTERPLLRGEPGSAPFDNDGVATADSVLVQHGRLERYVLSAYSARKLGLETTANAGGVRNLELEGEGHSFEDLLRRMGQGLLVTEMMGQGVNLVTGDYSRGVAGFWVEGGEVAHAVQEMTIAGNLADMLRGVQAIGTDTDRRGSIRAPSILLAPMTIAGG
ncbi:MAG: metalloprotease PmbA [Steroidobacteraceae bacterium]